MRRGTWEDASTPHLSSEPSLWVCSCDHLRELHKIALSGVSRAIPPSRSRKPARYAQHGSTDMNAHQQPHPTSVMLTAETRWSVCYRGEFLGLISTDGACTASFRLPIGYSIMPYHGQTPGPGWLTLKLGPDTSMALSTIGLCIGTIDFDRPVRVSSRFPRWIEITRVSPIETSSPSSGGRPTQSTEASRPPRPAQSDFDHRCDPRGPRGRKDDRNKSSSHSSDTRHRDRVRPGGCKSQSS